MSGESKLLVHFASKPEDWAQPSIRKDLLPSIEISYGESPSPGAAFHVLVSGRPRKNQLLASTQLRHLVVPWAGLPEVTLELLRDFPGIAIHNLHHNAQATAELAMALLLAAARRIVIMDQALRQGDWRMRYQGPHGIQLMGRRVLIVGYGHIGRRLAQIALAFGMQVTALRNSISRVKRENGLEIYPASDLDSLLDQTQVLMLCAPLTDATRHIINRERFDVLPAESILINVGRAELVDQWSLYQALVEGKIAAAGLDVWYQYPEVEAERENTMPAQAPFWELENVILSPHRGGLVADSKQQRTRALVSLLNELADGNSEINHVDRTQGY